MVYVTSPPLFVGPIGIILKKLFSKTKFIFEVRDLWPDSAIEIGELSNTRAIKMSYALENKLYKTADHIVAVTDSIRKDIINKGVSPEKVTLLYNGTDLLISRQNPDEVISRKYDITNHFTLLYAGNIGLAQNLRTVIDAVAPLRDKNIQLLIVGTGPEEKLLKGYVHSQKIGNVKFVGEVPRGDIGKYYAVADCGIVPLRNVRVFERALPSKLFDYMSVDLPILAGLKGEAKVLLEETNTGICFEPDSVTDLREKVSYLYENPEVFKKMSCNGYKTVKEKFYRKDIAEKLEKLLFTLLD